MCYADKNCRKLCTGGVPCSPEIQLQRTTIELWEGVSKKKAGRTYSTNRIRRLAKKVKIHNPLHKSLSEARELTKAAYTEYYNLKKKAHKLRGTFLDWKAEALAEAKNTKKSSVIKQLKHREQQCVSAWNIQHTLKKLKGGGVTKIEVTSNGQHLELTKKAEVKQACIEDFLKQTILHQCNLLFVTS